mmetsp:Transcript_96209/g.220581  ORF Transcript_96209/g.220581 Transcript_96209/m.220581 type:complete len:236 (+) Transcript_96209:573-1280(+)
MSSEIFTAALCEDSELGLNGGQRFGHVTIPVTKALGQVPTRHQAHLIRLLLVLRPGALQRQQQLLPLPGGALRRGQVLVKSGVEDHRVPQGLEQAGQPAGLGGRIGEVTMGERFPAQFHQAGHKHRLASQRHIEHVTGGHPKKIELGHNVLNLHGGAHQMIVPLGPSKLAHRRSPRQAKPAGSVIPQIIHLRGLVLLPCLLQRCEQSGTLLLQSHLAELAVSAQLGRRRLRRADQ